MKRLLGCLCEKYNSKAFVPILESDVVAFIYYLYLSHSEDASHMHLDTRVCQKTDRRFDFVVGAVNYEFGRPCIDSPKLVAEVKAFPYGFTDQQHRVHYYHVIDDDLPKLQSLKEFVDLRYMVLFDEDNYLRGFDTKAQSSRLECLIKLRNELDSEIIMVHLKKTANELDLVTI
jgi:hypothetical protein